MNVPTRQCTVRSLARVFLLELHLCIKTVMVCGRRASMMVSVIVVVRLLTGRMWSSTVLVQTLLRPQVTRRSSILIGAILCVAVVFVIIVRLGRQSLAHCCCCHHGHSQLGSRRPCPPRHPPCCHRNGCRCRVVGSNTIVGISSVCVQRSSAFNARRRPRHSSELCGDSQVDLTIQTLGAASISEELRKRSTMTLRYWLAIHNLSRQHRGHSQRQQPWGHLSPLGQLL